MKKQIALLALLFACAAIAPAQASYSTAPSASKVQAGEHVAKKGKAPKHKAPKAPKASKKA